MQTDDLDTLEETDADDDACECALCGKAFVWVDGLCTDTCAECQQRQDAIDAAQSDVDDAESDLESLTDELQDLLEQVAEKRAEIKAKRHDVKAARRKLAELETETPTEEHP